jgi:tetratricopeptide (TPR) repeat protein
MKKLIVFLVILLSLLAWNYKDKILSFFNQAQTSLVSDTSESNAFETSEFIDKYNVYINFENSFDKRVRESQEYYFKWADREESPPTNTNRVYGIMTLYDHSLEFLEEAIKKKPKIDEVDDLMKDVLKKATTLHNVVKNAHSYYDRQDYKDDDFVKAKKFHKELILAYDNYFISYAKMDPVFSDLQDRFNNFLINKYQESGELIKYNLIKGIKKAKQIIAIIGDLEGEELLKLDLGDFKKAVAEYRDVQYPPEQLHLPKLLKAV